MSWAVLMFAAVAAQFLGAGFMANGYKNDNKRLGLPGAALLLLAPFLFYAAGAMLIIQ